MRREELMRDVCWSDDDETCTARGNIEAANMEKNREKVWASKKEKKKNTSVWEETTFN